MADHTPKTSDRVRWIVWPLVAIAAVAVFTPFYLMGKRRADAEEQALEARKTRIERLPEIEKQSDEQKPATGSESVSEGKATAKPQGSAAAAFLEQMVDETNHVRFTLPNGDVLQGQAQQLEKGPLGVTMLKGNLTGARRGTFSFEVIALPEGGASVRGLVTLEGELVLYRLVLRNGQPVFVEQAAR